MVKLRDSWTNYVNDQTANPLKYFKPATLPELVAVLHEATQKGYKVKPIGSGHSSSDIAVTADFMIDTHALNRELDTRFLDLALRSSGSLRHPIPEKDDLFFVECGITIHAVNQALEKKGKALINMGAYDGQTIAGVLSTSTHGSGAGLGAFPAFLKAILLLGENGTLFHIEPSKGKGISSGPVRLAGGPSVRFIQDDDTFLSAGVSIGCMGIIYAVVIQVTDKYMLEENRDFSTWGEVKKELERGNILRQNRHLEVLVSPYRYKGKDHKCMVTRRNIALKEYRSPLIPRGHRKIVPELIVRLVPDVLLDAIIRFIINRFPKAIPWFVQTSLNTLTDKDYIDKSYKVLDLGADNNLAAFATEIALPASTYIAAVEEIIRVVTQSVEEGRQYLTAPFSLRFVKTNEFYLSMQYADPDAPGPSARPVASTHPPGDFVCMIEFPTVSGAIGGTQLLARIETALYPYGGIPHWGQINHISSNGPYSVDRLYPRFGDWMRIFRRLSPEGRFENDFMRRCGITPCAQQ